MSRPPSAASEPPVRPSQPVPIRIGTAGWSIPRTSAESFPNPGSHLERYARVLPCAEINSTFYRSPRPSTLTRWSASVPSSFRFSVKAPKSITHEAALAPSAAELRAFLNEARLLGTALGPILFQLPPKLAFDPARAQAFFNILRELHPGPVALEARHPSWFTPEADTLLQQLQIARVAADPAITPLASQPAGDPGLTYFRLHGSPRTYYSSYSPDFLSSLAATLASYQQRPSAEVWCIFDNTAHGHAAGNAVTLARHLQP